MATTGSPKQPVIPTGSCSASSPPARARRSPGPAPPRRLRRRTPGVAVLATGAGGGGGGGAGIASLLGGGDSPPSAIATATAQIPPAMLSLYQQAAAACPGLPWTVLAAIGTVESDNCHREGLPAAQLDPAAMY